MGGEGRAGRGGKRLFIAVDIDDATREQLGGIAARLRTALEPHTKASWVRPDRMHLTLHFLGAVEDAFEQRVRHALAAPIREAPFEVTFDGVGWFPEHGSPRVLWLGVRDGLEPLRRIHAALATLVGLDTTPVGLDTAPVGLDLSRALPKRTTEPYTPHLTLARFRDRVSRAKVAGMARIPAVAGPSRIDRVTLYASRLSPVGPAYVPLASAVLR